jgi:peptide/nickel transport system substrate-binding protein
MTGPPRPRSRAGARVASAVLIALATLVLSACGGGGPAAPAPSPPGLVKVKGGGTLTYGADQEPTGFNANTSKDNNTAVKHVTVQVLPSAFRAAPDFRPVLNSDLLDSAELTKADPEVVVYKLRRDAVWDDGTPISARDFAYAWRQQNGRDAPANDVASTTGYEDIASVAGSEGGRTVTVTFASPFSDWRSLFTDMLPAHVAERAAGGWNHAFDDGLPVSGGPFALRRYQPGRSLTLVRNTRYWAQAAKLDQIVFRFLPESAAQPAALRNREVDMIYPQPQLDLVQQVRQQPDVRTELSFGLSFEHLDFNFRNEHLQDLRVRQAFAFAIDREQIVERTVAQFDPKASVLGNRIWLSGQPHHVDQSGAFARRDLRRARQLLRAVGYAPGPDGVMAKGGRKLALRISTTAGNALREQQLVLIKSQAGEAGFELRIRNAPASTFFGRWLPDGEFDIANFAWVGTPFVISSNKAIYGAGSDSNYGDYRNARITRLFDQAIAEPDGARSAELGNQVDAQLWADMATLPLYQKPTFIAYRDTFGNIHDNPTEDGPFWNSGRWGLRASKQ